MNMLDISRIIKDFPLLERKINNKRIVYLDSTASSLKPKAVIEAVGNYYRRFGVNIFRGVYTLSEEATQAYEQTRETVAGFIKTDDPREIIFTRNATEAINLVASSWAGQNLDSRSNLISTVMEHHANIVPWQIIAKSKQAELKFIDIDDGGFLKQQELEKLVNAGTKLVALTYVSNVLGTINKVREIIGKIKKMNKDTLVLVDAAQAVPHLPVDVRTLGCDFLVFSAHKMLGPTGVGVLWAKYALLEEMEPYQTGGEMIKEVYLDKTVFNDPPYKFEAGTPDIAGVIGLSEAVKYLESLGLNNIRRHEEEITAYALEKLSQIDNLTIYGPKKAAERGGVIAFNVRGIHPHDLAQVLNNDNICIRSGHHCAMPLHVRFNIPASCRASFYLYNIEEDVDLLIEGIMKAVKIFN